MNQATEDNFVTENSKTAPGSSSDGITEVMDPNENIVDVVPDIQSKYIKNKTGNAKSKIQNDKTKEMTVASQPEKNNLKRKAVHPPRSNRVTKVMDSNEDIVPNILKSKSIKNKTGSAKRKIQNDKTKEMTVTSQPEKKNLKRKAVHPPSSNRVTKVMDSNEDIVPNILKSKSIKNKTGSAKPKIQNDKTKEMTVVSHPEKKNLKRKAVHTASSNQVNKVMDSNEDIVPNILKPKSIKNKTGSAKPKIQNDKTKKMAVVSQPERKNLKRKADHPPTSEMVIDSIRALKKRNGARFEDIQKYMEEKYAVDMKRLKYHAEKFLQKGADNGILEKIDRNGAEERFKIKKSESMKKDLKNLPRKERKVRPEKKMPATKKQIKK